MDQKTQLLIRVDDTLKTEVTEEEKKYREDNFPNENAILKKNLVCTACNKDLKERIVSRHQINVHPVLEVLWCSKCEEFYDDGNFSMDEDGSDKYCRWCAQGGQLYCCSYCSIAFCASCIRRNFKRTKVMKDIEADDWRCFVCVTEPLWNLRALCDAAKRYVESHLNRRKSHRNIKLKESDEETAETVDSEASSSTKSRKKKQTDKQPENSKSNTESEENVFVETNRNKRKRASSGEESTTQSKNKRKPREQVDPAVKENQKKKKDFESIVNEAINDFGEFRKILTKKESSLKKQYSNADISQLDEIIAKAQEEFSKVCNDAKTSLETIEKKITHQLSTLLSKPEEENPQSPVKDVQAPSAEPEEEPKDENAADVTIPTENTEEDSVKSSPTAPVNGQVEEGADDMSLTVICDEETPKEHPEDTSKTSKSINDSMAVNVSSIIDSLKTDDDTTIIENTIESKKPDDTIEDVEMVFDSVNDDLKMNENPKPTTDNSTQPKEEKIVDNSTLESCTNDDSPLSKDKASKLALLQSSTDNASSSDNEGTKAKSSDSELSGVSVLHSDPDEANTTRRNCKTMINVAV